MKLNSSIKLFVLTTLVGLHSCKDGISFVVVGDFGNTKNLNYANAVFDSINEMKRNAKSGSPEDFEFFVTTGDNVYPKVPSEPTHQEFEKVMNLFRSRDKIGSLPIYPVRGNHDCYFDDNWFEVNMSSKYPTWKMPSNYYEKQFQVGPNGEKFSLLQLDSCYFLCETVGNNKAKYFELLDLESQEIYADRCEHEFETTFKDNSNLMMQWLDKTNKRNLNDPSIIWKASSMHHPMFGMFY